MRGEVIAQRVSDERGKVHDSAALAGLRRAVDDRLAGHGDERSLDVHGARVEVDVSAGEGEQLPVS